MPRLPTFEVEMVSSPKRRGAPVFARQVSGGPVSVLPGSKLGGHDVRLGMPPRALDAEGRPRTDLFTFLLSKTARAQLVEGQRLVLESPNVTCAVCKASWPEPELSEDELTELQGLLAADERNTFVHRLQELTGLGLANAKRIFDHADFHGRYRFHCDPAIAPGFRTS